MVWPYKVCKSLHFWHTSPWPSLHGLNLYPQYFSSICSQLSHTVPNIRWREPSHPQHEQAMCIFICAEQISLSLSPPPSPLFVWRIHTENMDFLCRYHKPFSQYIGEYLWENALQPRTWGSDVKVLAAATLRPTTIVIYTVCTQTARSWLSYKLLSPIAVTNFTEEKINLRNLGQHFEWLIPEVCSGLLEQQPASSASVFCFNQ